MLSAKRQDLLIFGVDPGTATTGYGFINVTPDSIKVVDYGLIETEKNGYAPSRYGVIYRVLCSLLGSRKPDVMVIEKVFFATNAKTAIRVGQAQGVMLLSAVHNSIPVVEYAPGTIKKMVTGSGRAKKKEVQEHVKEILGSIEGGKIRENKAKRITKTHIDNVFDAFALALTHSFKLSEGRATV